MRRILATTVVFTILVTPVAGQIVQQQTNPFSNIWGGTQKNLFFGPGFGSHFGFGPFVPIVVPKEKAQAFFLTSFLFSGHRPTAAGTGLDSFFGGYPLHSAFYSRPYGGPFGGFGSPYYYGFSGYYGMGPQPALYNSARFVEEWKDRDPVTAKGESQGSSLQESILLSEGMDEDQVVQAIGSPLQRVQLGERSVWKYSGYSLLFQNGKLKEIR
ncbi:MAG TPA: hypothetical protein PLP42_11590 [Acidobacteriota bacterium]|nr:hypothetical protein [Acidobacteriota bacterium]